MDETIPAIWNTILSTAEERWLFQTGPFLEVILTMEYLTEKQVRLFFSNTSFRFVFTNQLIKDMIKTTVKNLRRLLRGKTVFKNKIYQQSLRNKADFESVKFEAPRRVLV